MINHANKPSEDEIQFMLKYLDIFYPNGEAIDPRLPTEQVDYPAYKPEVNEFFEFISERFVEDYVPGTTKLFSNPAMIANADWKSIKHMLIYFTRAERNSPSCYHMAFERGYLKEILLRIRELARM